MIGFNQVTSDWSRERHQFSVPIIERKLIKSLNTFDTQLKSNSNSWVEVDQNYLTSQVGFWKFQGKTCPSISITLPRKTFHGNLSTINTAWTENSTHRNLCIKVLYNRAMNQSTVCIVCDKGAWCNLHLNYNTAMVSYLLVMDLFDDFVKHWPVPVLATVVLPNLYETSFSHLSIYKDKRLVNRIRKMNGCKYMTTMYVNCGQRNKYGSDVRSDEHYLYSRENKVWKKIQARTENEWKL